MKSKIIQLAFTSPKAFPFLLLLALCLTNPSFDRFAYFIDQKRAEILDPGQNFAFKLGGVFGEYEICRRNLLIGSIYTATFRSVFLGREMPFYVCLGIAGAFIPLGIHPAAKVRWMRSQNCRRYYS